MASLSPAARTWRGDFARAAGTPAWVGLAGLAVPSAGEAPVAGGRRAPLAAPALASAPSSYGRGSTGNPTGPWRPPTARLRRTAGSARRETPRPAASSRVPADSGDRLGGRRPAASTPAPAAGAGVDAAGRRPPRRSPLSAGAGLA